MKNQFKDHEFITALSLLNPLVIEQTEDGYRYSIEPFLLADFVRLSKGCRLLDVGTGCGVIPLLLATRGVVEEIVAIEIQSSLYDLVASRNGIEPISLKQILCDTTSQRPSATYYDC